MNIRSIVAIILFAVIAIAIYYRWRLRLSGVHVTSWWRDPLKNYRVGGKWNSQHLIGWAFDVTPPTTANLIKVREMGFSYVANEGDHIHASVL